MADPAPLFVDTMRLATWVLRRFGGPAPLVRRIAEDSLALLDQVTLALRGSRRDERIAAADDRLHLLRIHLRLARELGLLDEAQLIYSLGECDGIGRQLGGWRRHLGGERREDST